MAPSRSLGDHRITNQTNQTINCTVLNLVEQLIDSTHTYKRNLKVPQLKMYPANKGDSFLINLDPIVAMVEIGIFKMEHIRQLEQMCDL